MRKQLYQIRDRIAGVVVGPIMAFPREAPAIREFEDLLANQQTTIGQHPADYDLHHIGQQDQDSGELDPIIPTTIYYGQDWVTKQHTKPAEALNLYARENNN